MGESSEMDSEDDKALQDKNPKRILKTRSQIEALESFYDEHKYPTESIKILVAERIGLTEKQISSWFCHRRLKDKKTLNGEVHVNGRQDRLSGVIQDLGSGPKQDSCGSTKQSDDRILGLVEIQSRRVNGHEGFSTDLTESGSHYACSDGRMDDTSSGSSSSPRHMYCNGDPIHVANSKFNTRSIARYVNNGKPRSGPSGYLKMKGRVENVVITAVKRRLGSRYRKDGPPLGIKFDPLPQEAFESSTQQPTNETYYSGETVAHHPSQSTNLDQQYLSKPYHVKEHNSSLLEDLTRNHKQPTSSIGCEYTSDLSLPKAVPEGKSSKMTRGSEHSRSLFCQMSKPEFSLSDHTSIDMHKESAQEMASYDMMNHNEGSTMLSDYGFRMDTFSTPQHFQPPDLEVNPEQGESFPSNERRRKVGLEEHLHSSCSDIMSDEPKSEAFEDQWIFKKAAKVNNHNSPRRKFDDDYDAIQQNVSPNNQMCGEKDEYPPFVEKMIWEGGPEQMNQITRSPPETPSSCSEDAENVDTTSSEDSETEV